MHPSLHQCLGHVEAHNHVKTGCCSELTHVHLLWEKVSMPNKSGLATRKPKDTFLRQCLAEAERVNGWVIVVEVLGTYRLVEKVSLCRLMARTVDEKLVMDQETRQQN